MIKKFKEFMVEAVDKEGYPEVHADHEALKKKSTPEVHKQHQGLNRVSGKYTPAEVGGKRGMISDILHAKHGKKKVTGYFKEDAEQLDEAEQLSDSHHAAAIRSSADKQLKRDMKADDPKFHKYHKQGHAELHKIADHVARGEHKKAYARMKKLDTSTKDAIPQRAYTHITKHGYENG